MASTSPQISTLLKEVTENYNSFLQHYLSIPSDLKIGKLPGLYGGKTSCTGGDPAHDCFSTRIMWRENGKGELYLYANREAQDPAICQMPNNYCSPKYGWSLNTGAWTFQRGAWTDIEETITLNTPGVRNGVLSVKVNGQEVIR